MAREPRKTQPEKKAESIIHPRLNGTCLLISGLHGLGKTSLALSLERPEKTAMIDFDLKSAGICEQFGIWYARPEAESDADFNVETLSQWFLETLLKIPGHITHLIIDNATWAEQGLALRVQKYPEKYGVNKKNAQTGMYGGVNPGIGRLWSAAFLHLQNQGVEVVTAVNHMSAPWVDGKPLPNRYNVRGNRIFHQISSLGLILVPGDSDRGGAPPAPAALIIKEAVGVQALEEGRLTTKRALPSRLPEVTWPNVFAYFFNPMNFDKPKPGESWSKFEANAYGDWLSDEQIEFALKTTTYTEDEADIHWTQDEQKRTMLKDTLKQKGLDENPLAAYTKSDAGWAQIKMMNCTGQEFIEGVERLEAWGQQK